MRKEHPVERTFWWRRQSFRPAAGARRNFDTDIFGYSYDGWESHILRSDRGWKGLPTGVGYGAELSGPLHRGRGLEEIAPGAQFYRLSRNRKGSEAALFLVE